MTAPLPAYPPIGPEQQERIAKEDAERRRFKEIRKLHASLKQALNPDRTLDLDRLVELLRQK